MGLNSRNDYPQCVPKPYMEYDAIFDIKTLTCAPPEKDATKEGNNVQFQIIGNVLTILETKFDYCDPTLVACGCYLLLGKLLKLENFVRIVGRRPSIIPPPPNVQPDEEGCRCLLQRARNAGFKYVKIGSVKPECFDTRPIIDGNKPLYLGVCSEYAKKQCFNDKDLWQIVKERKDIP